ncbi:MAG TPA: hypothetical protein ENJ61_08820 [Aquifex aeolicus]|uniref:CARD domain-containing protein n=1 Tax=Aquifex aeolicus TaxID=63363 RepID=A0A7C5L4A0_AQUAO|nr:hypothetical protein [Aquifex aeolicus]
MREALILLFLIVSYNFILWFITEQGLSPVPLFPQDVYHVILVLSFNSVLYISWLFGERHRTVQWIGYLFFFQIVALSFYFRSLEIVVRDLPPVIFTFALVALFESPTEKEIKSIEREREELLVEMDRIRRERERIDARLRMLRQEIRKLEEERSRAEVSSAQREELEERLRKLQEELEEYREKESRLLESNRKLFQLLDMLRSESDVKSSREELTGLRKERRKLIKELIQLQELVDIYADENEKLKEENRKLSERLKDLQNRLSVLEIEVENLSRKPPDPESAYREILSSLPEVEISDRALGELIRSDPDKRRSFVRELIKFSLREGKGRIEPLSTLKGVYKLKFSGGRIYVRRKGERWEVVGFLDSEDEKEKERYIRNVLSRLS